MKALWLLVLLVVVLSVSHLGCTRGAIGGNPTLAVSGTNGTSRVLNGSEAEVGAAITNAFDNLKYHDMLFVPVDEGIGATLARGWVVTNGFQLLPGMEALCVVPVDNGKSLPYDATFYITIAPAPSNRTTVLVRTTTASLRDGVYSDIHSSQAIRFRPVKPLQREEDNVLTVISEQLSKVK